MRHNQTKPHTIHVSSTASVVIVLMLIAIVALLFFIRHEPEEPVYVPEPQRATLVGTYVCLPHKDTAGPQTEECAYGIKTDTGEYYAIDFALMSQTSPGFQAGKRFEGSGVIVDIRRLSTDHWNAYNVAGIFSVTDMRQNQ